MTVPGVIVALQGLVVRDIEAMGGEGRLGDSMEKVRVRSGEVSARRDSSAEAKACGEADGGIDASCWRDVRARFFVDGGLHCDGKSKEAAV